MSLPNLPPHDFDNPRELRIFYEEIIKNFTNLKEGSSQLNFGRTVHNFHKQTTTADVTTIYTLPTGSDHAYQITLDVVSLKSDGSSAGGYIRAGTFKNNSGTVTQAGSTTSVHTAEDAAGQDVVFTISGTDILVKVTGVALTTIEWVGFISYLDVRGS